MNQAWAPPLWLQAATAYASFAAAVATVVAGGAAVIALISWQRQRRLERISAAAERALIASSAVFSRVILASHVAQSFLESARKHDPEFPLVARVRNLLDRNAPFFLPHVEDLRIAEIQLHALGAPEATSLSQLVAFLEAFTVPPQIWILGEEEGRPAAFAALKLENLVTRGAGVMTSYSTMRAGLELRVRYAQPGLVGGAWRRLQEEMRKAEAGAPTPEDNNA